MGLGLKAGGFPSSCSHRGQAALFSAWAKRDRPGLIWDPRVLRIRRVGGCFAEQLCGASGTFPVRTASGAQHHLGFVFVGFCLLNSDLSLFRVAQRSPSSLGTVCKLYGETSLTKEQHSLGQFNAFPYPCR